MPRGIPNAKRDESAMRFTSFHVPLPYGSPLSSELLNPKHGGGSYIKSDTQTLWYRNSVKGYGVSKGRSALDDTGSATPVEGRRGSKVLVIHPGSRFLRIGRASDVTPVTIPNAIARKHKPPVPPPVFVESVTRPHADAERHIEAPGVNGDEYSVSVASNDPFDQKVAAITVSLRDRMRFYKLRVTQNAASIASTFNEQFHPETIPQENDPFRVDWVNESDEESLVGEKAFRIADPERAGYVVRWPIYNGKLNTRDYTSNQSALSDIETILRITMQEKLNIDPRTYQEYSVVLVIPDFYDRAYVQAFVRLLLAVMGFKQLCVQQESLAATYGAGISNACVVDMGAVKTSIACVDDGLVLPDTRLCLNMGGDDITEFLYALLSKVSFPYKDIDLARWYDWSVMEDLKARLCTLAEGDVALNLYDFVVRRPGRPTEKYGLRAYDEIILAPMCLFEPRVIEFEKKRAGMRPMSYLDVSEEVFEQLADQVSQAMVISTQHLIPAALPSHLAPAELPSVPPSDPQTPGTGAAVTQAVTPEPTTAEATSAEDTPAAVEVKEEPTQPVIPAKPAAVGQGTADAPMEIDDDDTDTKPGLALLDPSPPPIPQAIPTYAGGYTIDVCYEASKLPLDVAIFNSARAAGGNEKIRKYLQAVLVIGGTALIPGMAHALESRLQAIATPLVPNMEKVQIIPPPKDVDPRVLAWKGAAVLGRMDGVADLWITAAEWDVFGMRGLKERCFYL